MRVNENHVCAWLIFITGKLVHFKHFHPCVGVLSGKCLQYNPQPWGTLHGLTGEPYQSCELAQYVSRTEPSAPGELISKSSVIHFHYNRYTENTAYCITQTIVNLTLRTTVKAFNWDYSGNIHHPLASGWWLRMSLGCKHTSTKNKLPSIHKSLAICSQLKLAGCSKKLIWHFYTHKSEV